LCRPIFRWPRTWGQHGVAPQVRCTRAHALGMAPIDLSGISGWAPTRAHAPLKRDGLVSPNSSMATQLGTPWGGATGPFHSRGFPGMVTIDLSGISGWSPTRACTRLGRGGLVSPNSSMATHLGTPWRGATGPLHSRGCPGDSHHRSLWHLPVVGNPRMHAAGEGWTCVAQ